MIVPYQKMLSAANSEMADVAVAMTTTSQQPMATTACRVSLLLFSALSSAYCIVFNYYPDHDLDLRDYKIIMTSLVNGCEQFIRMTGVTSPAVPHQPPAPVPLVGHQLTSMPVYLASAGQKLTTWVTCVYLMQVCNYLHLELICIS